MGKYSRRAEKETEQPVVVETTEVEVEVEETVDAPEVEVAPVEVEAVKEVEVAPVVEKPVVAETKVVPVAPVGILDCIGVEKLLSTPGIAFADKLHMVVENGDTAFKSLASKLLSYARRMGPDSGIVSAEKGAGENFNLLNTLMGVLAEQDKKTFKVKFDLVNMVFKTFNKQNDAYNVFSLNRFDSSWKAGKDSLAAFQNLTDVISRLCDRTTRQEKFKGLDLSKALDINIVKMKASEVDKVKEYYMA